VLEAVRSWAQRRGHRLTAIAITGNHGHLLIELPRDQPKAEVGKLKRVGSLAVRDELPGRVWSRGCDVVPVITRERQLEVMDYIVKHHRQGGAVWKWGDAAARAPD